MRIDAIELIVYYTGMAEKFDRRKALKLIGFGGGALVAGALALETGAGAAVLDVLEKLGTNGQGIYPGFTLEQASKPAVRDLEERVGLEFPILLKYKSWADGDIDDIFLGECAQSEKVPLVTWMPWDPKLGVEQPNFSLSRIVQGDFDGYIRRNAYNMKGFDKPLFLRFAHEMNGDWYPWSGTVNGNKPEEYVQAWNHVQDIFREVGVTNVTWVWSPNVAGAHNDPGIGAYFPGDDRIDWAGFDGYNWGNTQEWSSWESLATLINKIYPELTKLTRKPIMIAETASTEHGGNKAQWIAEGLKVLPNYDRIRALIWFNLNKETNWEIQSSPQSQAAYNNGMRDRRFHTTVQTENGKIVA